MSQRKKKYKTKQGETRGENNAKHNNKINLAEMWRAEMALVVRQCLKSR